jgi:hypothetical protein
MKIDGSSGWIQDDKKVCAAARARLLLLAKTIVSRNRLLASNFVE